MRKEIKSELRSLFDRVIKKFSEKDFWDPEKYKLERPFHSSLITVDFWISPKFERSFTTSLGQTVYERVAKCIASQFGDKAENKKRIERYISTGELNTIQTILNELDLSTEEIKEKGLERKPNWKKEIEEVLQSKTDEQVRTVVIMDLYFRRNEREYFFEIKSSKPNKDQSKVSKEKMLKLQAMYNGKVNTYFAFPDNPYLKRELYAHSLPMIYFDMRKSPAVLMGKGFWDFIGTEGVYEELISIFKQVGEEYKEEINKILGLD